MFTPKRIVGAAVSGLVGLVLVIVLLMSVEVVGQGERGVIYSRSSGVQEETLDQGWKLVSPLDKVTTYPVSTVTVKESKMPLATKDGKPLTVDMTYDYFNNTEKLPEIYNKFKGANPEDIEASWLKARLTNAALSVTGKYTILEIFQKRDVINTEIKEKFKKDVDTYGFEVENVVFGTPVPDAQTQKAMQAVVNAQQELETLKVQKQKAQLEAEKKKIEAEGNAQKAIIEAQGNSKADALRNKNLTPQLIELKKIDKWDGKNSTHVLGGTGVNINTK